MNMKQHVQSRIITEKQEVFKMNWWDYLLTGLSVLCTSFSILGAYKSNKYYRKSKALTNYANTNIAYIESQKIVSILTEILKLANNSRRQRGTNYLKEVSLSLIHI